MISESIKPCDGLATPSSMVSSTKCEENSDITCRSELPFQSTSSVDIPLPLGGLQPGDYSQKQIQQLEKNIPYIGPQVSVFNLIFKVYC